MKAPLFLSFIAASQLSGAQGMAEVWDDALRVEVKGQSSQQSSTLPQLPSTDDIDDTRFSADSLASLLKDSPMVNLNGQGGLFQTLNIRGFARWRVQTFVEGIPIYSERRAGTAAEFLSPLMVDHANIYSGTAGALLGGNAIGGAVDYRLRTDQSPAISLRVGAENAYIDTAVTGTTEQQAFSWLFNHRHANNSQDGNRNPIQDQFEMTTGLLRKRSDSGWLRDALIMHSETQDAAKASVDDPTERLTLYPKNQHTLGKTVFDWHNATLYVHRSHLTTHIDRPGTRFNQIDSRAINTGASINDAFAKMPLSNIDLRWRLGVDARLNVTIDEREANIVTNTDFEQRTLDAQQWEFYAGIDGERSTTSNKWLGGIRVSSTRQESALSTISRNDNATRAYLNYTHNLNTLWYVSTQLGYGKRIPSLTERFFNGTTPRGEVFGDENLSAETAQSADLSLNYQSVNTTFAVSVFHQTIDDYIEQLAISDTVRTYQNLPSADIRGVNYRLTHTRAFGELDGEIVLGGQWLDGKDNNHQAIADIVPNQHRISLSLYSNKADGFIALTHRASSDEVVSGELPTESVNVVDLGYRYSLTPSMRFALNLTNATNEQYVTSRDDLAPFAKGREWVLSMDYQF